MGLDNIAPLDRSKLPPEVGYLEQAYSTAWMAMYALDLLNIALRLAGNDLADEDVATKFIEHFLLIANSANATGLWDDEDAFFYDILHLADGRDVPMKVRSLVGWCRWWRRWCSTRTKVSALPEFRVRVLVSLEPPQDGTSCSPARKRRGPSACSRWCCPAPEAHPGDGFSTTSGMLSDHGIHGNPGVPPRASVQRRGRRRPRRRSTTSRPNRRRDSSAATPTGVGPSGFPLNVLFVEALRNYGATGSPATTVEFPEGSGTFPHPPR